MQFKIILAMLLVSQNLFASEKAFHAKRDLDAIYHQIKENHPGVYNEEDPLFNKNMKHAYGQAKQFLSKAGNAEQQKQAITNFAKSFNDTHLSVHWDHHNKKLSEEESLRSFTNKTIVPEMYWVTLPTFAMPADQEQEFRHVIADLAQQRQSKAIIFDIRGNQGGNSDYGTHVVIALFGAEYVAQQKKIADQNVIVDWRASRDNAAYLSLLSEKICAPWFQDIVQGVDASIKHHKHYYRESMHQKFDCQKHKALSHDVSAKIFVIIDQGNVSAALDFIDDLKCMNYPITLIGQITKADRLYMEQRTIPLPSGLGDFSFPIKVYRNRIRQDNEPYRPDIEIDTHNTENLELTIKRLV